MVTLSIIHFYFVLDEALFPAIKEIPHSSRTGYFTFTNHHCGLAEHGCRLFIPPHQAGKSTLNPINVTNQR